MGPGVAYVAASHPPFLIAVVEPTYLWCKTRHNVKP